MQRHEHERANQHHFEPHVQVEDVAREERTGNTHQYDLDQRVVAQRFAARIHARKRRTGHRHANHADHHHHHRTEHIRDQRDVERSRPRCDLENLDAGALDSNEDRHGCGEDAEGTCERDYPQQTTALRQQVQHDSCQQRQ